MNTIFLTGCCKAIKFADQIRIAQQLGVGVVVLGSLTNLGHEESFSLIEGEFKAREQFEER